MLHPWVNEGAGSFIGPNQHKILYWNIRPNKKISVVQVTGLKILGTVVLITLFSTDTPFKMNKVFSSRKTKKPVNLGKVGKTWVTLNTGIFFIWPNHGYSCLHYVLNISLLVYM